MRIILAGLLSALLAGNALAGASDVIPASVVHLAGHTRYEIHLGPAVLPTVAWSAR